MTTRIGWRRWLKRIVIVSVALLLMPLPMILLLWVVQPPMTAVMAQQTLGRVVSGDRPLWPRHTTMSRDKISINLRKAVIASEDDRFYEHRGIDFVEINAALERRKRTGKLRGASTITQQVAKNLFLWNGRSYIRKGLELYLTLLLELCLSKERILDVYLNMAEWGPSTYGAEAAARLHFGKSAAQLTRDDAARLAAILPSPKRWSPKGSIATRRAAVIAQRMR
ncbi:MAG: monofunctional biosynthetic peptidoglycan transglycosylase [Gemmatimonadaceae bacterium]|nr:monofunctional biosynthetic peptidoglycan transglycosylase [Gemmatimonadaceae bacterium]